MFYYIGFIMDVVSRMRVFHHKLYCRDAFMAHIQERSNGNMYSTFTKRLCIMLLDIFLRWII